MRPHKVVLCLHRDPVVRSTLVVVLPCWGYRVTTSLNGEELPAAVVTDAPLSESLARRTGFLSASGKACGHHPVPLSRP